MTKPRRPRDRKEIQPKPVGAGRRLTKRFASQVPLPHDLIFREFIAELFAAAAGMQSLRRAIAHSVGLGGAEFAVLLAVWQLGQTRHAGIKAIATHLHVAGPHVTDEVARLVRYGYLRKMADTRDTRAVVLHVTARGERLLASLAPTLNEINFHLFDGVSPNDMKKLRLLFQRLIHRSARSIEQLRKTSAPLAP